ncbi:thiamine phosphate synthase [Sphingomonas sp. C3-2]|uniref:thiamine phosphate synthase n=1 Tax=Sphingomonas sp. C3-2 TaxID=3062169 RepID=UPI00294B3B29|nr:thiamine phosphate synthase [Sphingomonas sp. C3-2]WOK35158.1 thiamine phosphate synthase [Sphingomonas sp. C3-2]
MTRRHPRNVPSLWLMTDERMGARLLPAVKALPRGAGIVFRHYSLGDAARRALFHAVRAEARRRRITLLLAATPTQARQWGANGFHGRSGRALPGQLHSAPVHNARELRAAQRRGADIVFISPLHATRSHPGSPALRRFQAAALIRAAGRPVIGLGGMTSHRARALKIRGLHGWAAIDALTPQPR